MLLFSALEEVVPLGLKMWERVADDYNAKRLRNTSERNVDSLKCKFENLYYKPKPSRKGEVSMNCVISAKEIQIKIEAEGGAT
ncbi:LOW QUALITY PROTEIN: Hypothetical protein PHPALM_19976 [Phytophthora palmivora]|uniref:DUF6818 domain-containing protein n=1 Tax=Phytophthora palmivora TaxID=4796 RepID=A0A2P4XG05_9STRA|nr:LOW QUALITY PROTEIN: Hypothetical protein PHPALM_19976 [Phytophthora palmivora]